MDAALNGPQGRTTLGPEPLRLGRSQDNTLIVSDPQSSSHHAEITPGPDGASYILTDLGSTNGTFVNEQRLAAHAPQPLRSGDVIRIGNTRYNYEAVGAIEATVRASGPEFSNPPSYEPTVFANPSSGAGIPSTTYNPPPQENYGYANANANPYSSSPTPEYAPPPPSYTPGPAYNPQPGIPNYQPAQGGYTPGAPGNFAPGTPGGFAPFQPPPKKSNAGLIIGIIVVAVLVIGGAIFGVSYANRSTPQKTLDTVCDSFKTSNAQELYDTLSSESQKTTSVEKLKQLFSLLALAGGVKSCAYSDIQESGVNATAKLDIKYNNSNSQGSDSGNGKDDKIHLVNENGTWKVNEDMGTGGNS